MKISNQNNLSFHSRVAYTPTFENALKHANDTIGEKYTRRVIDVMYKSMKCIECDGKNDIVKIKRFGISNNPYKKLYASFISGNNCACDQITINALNLNSADLNAMSTLLRNLATRLDPHFYPDTLFAPNENKALNQLEEIKKLLVEV